MKKLNANTAQHLVKKRFHLFQGILPLGRSAIGNDIVAGLVLATIGIPEVMGYTKIAGTSIATGLYTLILPAMLFAIFGSSRHLVVAADSATAAILAAGLSGLAPFGSSQYLALAELVAILVAGLLLLARLFRLGFLSDFLSRTVLIGFLTGVGVQVAIVQLAGLLNLKGGGHQPIQQIMSTFKGLPDANPLSLIISLAVMITILLCGKFLPKFPGALLAVIGAIVASWMFDFSSRGVMLVGFVPSGALIGATRSCSQSNSAGIWRCLVLLDRYCCPKCSHLTRLRLSIQRGLPRKY
jgi:sulfate permease, SulP family